MGEGEIQGHSEAQGGLKNLNNDELSLYFRDGEVFVLISIWTALNRPFCATLNNQPMQPLSLDKGETMSTYRRRGRIINPSVARISL